LSVAGADITAMKDPTRMGLAGAASEMATKGGVGIELRQDRIPVPSDVKGASEMLGLNPLQIANEGIALLGVRPTAAADVNRYFRRDTRSLWCSASLDITRNQIRYLKRDLYERYGEH
jgi:hydrogenase maturation factor